ncbi:MAG TPA: Gfo/Idh/MocA family oxidoreductase [Opitutales bacterium]|nr:Gfo/Idh/MocA family oxidoreductase [Opitutales bacterium]
MNIGQTRRDFIKKSVGAGALLGFPTIIPSSVLGQNGKVAPSNRVAVGVIGCGGQSGACISYVNYEKSEIVAVCDPFKSRQKRRGEQWNAPHRYTDFRDLLARDDIDAVHVVTPDHWHVPISLEAARAGKDIYCEKPLGISIEQDLAAREIVAKHKRIFQYGTQQRSSDVCRMGIDLVLNGHIGEVREIYVWAPAGVAGGGDPTPQPIPEDLDYDLWLGPAPMKPYSPDRVSNRGAWYVYDYALGFIAGWGAHPLDQLQWWADQAGLGIPVEYATTGSIANGPLFDTVDQWEMQATYANGMKLRFYDNKTAGKIGPHLPAGMGEPMMKRGDGTMFVGTRGWVSVSRGALMASSEELRRQAKDPGPIRLPVSRNHRENFVDGVLGREQPVATLDSAIQSDIISHMGDIGIRTGETVKWDPVKQTVVGDSEAVRMMHRPMREPWAI